MATAWRWPPEKARDKVGERGQPQLHALQGGPGCLLHRFLVHEAEPAGQSRGRGRDWRRRRDSPIALASGRSSRCRATWHRASSGCSTGLPAKRISPLSAVKTPDRILISVDLPAPLWPSSPSTSPRQDRGSRSRRRARRRKSWRCCEARRAVALTSSRTAAVGHVDPDGSDQDESEHHLLQRRRQRPSGSCRSRGSA